MPEPHRSQLREVRAGDVALADVLEHLETVTDELDRASEDPLLPPTSDVTAVDRFVVDAYRSTWDAQAAAT